MPNKKFWTNEKNTMLAKLREAGVPVKQIALHFGTTERAVYAQAHRLNITWKRPTPQDIGEIKELNLADNVAASIKTKKKNLRELADEHDVSPKKILDAIQQLRDRNILIDTLTDGGFKLARDIAPSKPSIIDVSIHREVEYPKGFVADTHLGSKYERNDVLNAL